MTYYALFPMFPKWVALAAVTILIIFGTLRLTRLVTTDSLGGWLLRDPLIRWASRKESRLRGKWRSVIAHIEKTGKELDEPAALLVLRKSEELRGDGWLSWQGRLVSGLSCPFCVGFWVGLGVLGVTEVLSWSWAPWYLWTGWIVALAALSLNYLTAHISTWLD